MIELDKKLNISELLDIYGALLTPHQAEMLRLYFDCDISLFEIAEQFDISRQAVRDAIVRGEKTLNDIDNKLNFRHKLDSAVSMLNGLIEGMENGDFSTAFDTAKKIRDTLEE